MHHSRQSEDLDSQHRRAVQRMLLTGRRSEDGVSDFKVTVDQPWLD